MRPASRRCTAQHALAVELCPSHAKAVGAVPGFLGRRAMQLRGSYCWRCPGLTLLGAHEACVVAGQVFADILGSGSSAAAVAAPVTAGSSSAAAQAAC